MGSRLRNQYDELNVLERVFDDIMMFENDDPVQLPSAAATPVLSAPTPPVL